MIPPTLFNNVLVIPFINILLLFVFLFEFLHLPGAFGWSIVALTVFIRLLLHPMSAQQVKLAKKMEEMKPHLDLLSKKHKNDKKKLQSEQMRLYQEMGINPASGCLYAIIQIPVFIGLYNVLQLFLNNGNIGKVVPEVNKIVYFNFLKIAAIDPYFFGINLAISPSQFGKYGIWYLIIPVITALLQYWQTTVMMPKKNLPKKDNEKKDPDMQSIMQGQMRFMFPIMIGYFSYILPVGLSIYWNVFSLFSIVQYQKK